MIDYGIYEIKKMDNDKFIIFEQLEGKESRELLDLRAVVDYIDYELEQVVKV